MRKCRCARVEEEEATKKRIFGVQKWALVESKLENGTHSRHVTATTIFTSHWNMYIIVFLTKKSAAPADDERREIKSICMIIEFKFKLELIRHFK